MGREGYPERDFPCCQQIVAGPFERLSHLRVFNTASAGGAYDFALSGCLFEQEELQTYSAEVAPSSRVSFPSSVSPGW